MAKTDLSFLLEYYDFNRQAGHTHLTLFGLMDELPNGAFLVAANAQHAVNLRKDLKGKDVDVLTRAQIPDRMLGFKKPLTIDHFALRELVTDHERNTIRGVLEYVERHMLYDGVDHKQARSFRERMEREYRV